MKKFIILLTLAIVAGVSCSQAVAKNDKKAKKNVDIAVQAPVAPVLTLTTEADSLAYCAGQMATNGLLDFARKRYELDDAQVEIFIEGFISALKKDSTLSDMSRSEKFLKAYYDRKVEAQKAEGKQWLADNAKKDSVVVLPSGLQYKVLKQGNGPVATKDQSVKVHYEGRLIDGKVFDSSYRRGEPASFKPSGVIAGWTEALCLMPQGSVWELYIPQELGYGERGAGRDIPPYATLIFKIELLEVK